MTNPPKLSTEKSTLHQWYRLVTEAQSAVKILLGEELESYLVFLLMRFITRSDLSNTLLALDLLRTTEETSVRVNAITLQKVGDSSLLLAGFFPNRAKKKHVKITYFINMGKTAYQLRSHCFSRREPLFQQLSSDFVKLMDVIQAMHHIDNPNASKLLLPLEAYEQWQETGSATAKHILLNACGPHAILHKI